MLNLTEKDFQLLIDGLDELPNKGFGGEVLSALFMSAVAKDDESREKLMNEQKKKDLVRQKEKDLLKEEIRILQGKLLMLKRYLQENNILQQAYDTLQIPTR